MSNVMVYVVLIVIVFSQFGCCTFRYAGNLNYNPEFIQECQAFCGKKNVGELRLFLKDICGYSVEFEKLDRTKWGGFRELRIYLWYGDSADPMKDENMQTYTPVNMSLRIYVYQTKELSAKLYQNEYPHYAELGEFEELDKCIVKSISCHRGISINADTVYYIVPYFNKK